MCLEGGNSVRSESLVRAVQSQVVFGNGENIFASVAKRWNVEVELRQAMIQVATEPALGYSGFRVLVRGSDHPHIDCNFRIAAEAVVRSAI